MRTYSKLLTYLSGVLLTAFITVPVVAGTDSCADVIQNDAAGNIQVLKAVDSSAKSESENIFFSRLSLKEMVKDADMVFLGVVNKIEYVMSTPADTDHGRVPFTFVTYNVVEVLKGNSSAEIVTLQFIGGLDTEKMRYMATNQTPQFDLGDQDILFVQGNTQEMCPLVGNKNGRLRIVDGKVYTETGRSVGLGGNEFLLIGKLNRLQEVETTNVEGQEFSLGYDSNIKAATGSNTIDMEQILEKVRALSPESFPGGEFINANPMVPFQGPDMRPAAPPSN